MTEAVGADEGVEAVTPAIPNDGESPTAVVWRIIPTSAPQDEATGELVSRLRSDVLPAATAGDLDVSVTGGVAVGIDFSDYLSARLPWFFAAVLTLSFLLLMVVFRSLLVPLKAVLMNLLSIAAAYGVVVAGFQWGWLGEVMGFDGAPIPPFLPMMLFAIVFGLSMDYEVFLLSRVREEWDRTGDSHLSVANGLAATARVITAAALIMVFVFGSFLLEDDRVIQLFGTGLATAVLLDATIVRMLLVPATMELLGDRNWWLPGWLDRILPRVDVEGHHDIDPAADERRRCRRVGPGPGPGLGRRRGPRAAGDGRSRGLTGFGSPPQRAGPTPVHSPPSPISSSASSWWWSHRANLALGLENSTPYTLSPTTSESEMRRIHTAPTWPPTSMPTLAPTDSSSSEGARMPAPLIDRSTSTPCWGAAALPNIFFLRSTRQRIFVGSTGCRRPMRCSNRC